MKKMVHIIKAVGVFFKTLFQPFVPVASFSENGHGIVVGWEDSPEEGHIERSMAIRELPEGTARLGLYCVEGPHVGELFFLRRKRETIGKSLNHTVVLTPRAGAESRTYTVLVNGEVSLLAETGRFFRLNGTEHCKSDLYDYDEIELLGNRFLVLDLRTTKQSVQNPLTREGRDL